MNKKKNQPILQKKKNQQSLTPRDAIIQIDRTCIFICVYIYVYWLNASFFSGFRTTGICSFVKNAYKTTTQHMLLPVLSQFLLLFFTRLFDYYRLSSSFLTAYWSYGFVISFFFCFEPTYKTINDICMQFIGVIKYPYDIVLICSFIMRRVIRRKT